jgi:uncharacterized protein (UPF0332 family)
VPQTGEHLQRASQNLQFAESFDLVTTPYIDWAVTAYFYAALHLVDALLWHKDQINPGDHDLRLKAIKDKYYLRGIKSEYWTLKNKSENARYDLITFTNTKIRTEIVPRYAAIEQHVLQQLPNEIVDQYRWLSRPKAKA